MIVFSRNQSIMKHGIPMGSGEDSPSFFIVKKPKLYGGPLHEQENT